MTVTKEKVGLVLLGATLVTNPLTNQYVQQGVDWALTEISKQSGAYVTLVTAVFFTGWILVNMYQSGRIKVPKKTAKTKPQAYIDS
jgi:hypothetical protein